MSSASDNLKRLAKVQAPGRPQAYDAGHMALVGEFSGVDLTDEEQLEFADVLRLRLGSNADQIAARAILVRLRKRLADAVNLQIEHLQAQGVRITRQPKTEAFRALQRDGLNELYVRAKLTKRQASAGIAYRLRYEAQAKGLRSTLEQSTGRSPTVQELQAMRVQAARWSKQLRDCDQRVIQDCGEPALVLLHKVAGEAFALAGLVEAATRRTKSARTYDQAARLLGRALDVCAILLPIQA